MNAFCESVDNLSDLLFLFIYCKLRKKILENIIKISERIIISCIVDNMNKSLKNNYWILLWRFVLMGSLVLPLLIQIYLIRKIQYYHDLIDFKRHFSHSDKAGFTKAIPIMSERYKLVLREWRSDQPIQDSYPLSG